MENTENQVIIYKKKKHLLRRHGNIGAEKYRNKEFPNIWLENMSVQSIVFGRGRYCRLVVVISGDRE